MTAIQPIDKPFLESVLKEPVLDFKVTAGCKVGDNVAGSLKAITASTASGDHHFVFKRFPEVMTQENGFVVFSKAFWREHAIYKTVLPKLEDFAKGRGLQYEAPAPKYFTGHNDDKHDFILLEDVRPSGFLMPDKTKTLEFGEVAIIMKEFARLHAISHAFLREEGEKIFKDIDGFQYLVQDEFMRNLMEVNFQLLIMQFYNASVSVLEDHFPEAAEQMKIYSKNTGKLHSTLEHLTDKKCFPTLCHYDLWSNNMLIKHSKGKPVAVKFIDFQFMQRGNVYSDLLYLLYTSTTPDFRKVHLNAVLNLYYDEFTSTMDAMKAAMPWGFTRGSFIDQFHAGIITAFVRMTFAVPLQLGLISETKPTKDPADPNEEPEFGHSEAGIRKMYEDSPQAVERLKALAKEMMDLKLFDLPNVL